MFMETSAKAGHNVKSLFKKIAMSLVGMEKENEAAESQNTSACAPVVYSLVHLKNNCPRNRCDITTNQRGTGCFSVSVLSAIGQGRIERIVPSVLLLFVCSVHVYTFSRCL